MDAWPDYQTIITRPQKEVRALATEDQAAHPLDFLHVGIQELGPGTKEKNLDTPDSHRF